MFCWFFSGEYPDFVAVCDTEVAHCVAEELHCFPVEEVSVWAVFVIESFELCRGHCCLLFWFPRQESVSGSADIVNCLGVLSACDFLVFAWDSFLCDCAVAVPEIEFVVVAFVLHCTHFCFAIWANRHVFFAFWHLSSFLLFTMARSIDDDIVLLVDVWVELLHCGVVFSHDF